MRVSPIGKLLGQSSSKHGAASEMEEGARPLQLLSHMIAQQVSRTGRLVGRAPRNITVVLTRALPVILSIARKVSQSGRLLGRRQSESGAATKRAQGARPLQHLNRMIAKRVTKIGRLDGLGQRKAGAVP